MLGTITNPNLPADTIDLALMVDVYHEFSHPYEMIKNISNALKTGGRIAFVEYRMEDPKVTDKIITQNVPVTGTQGSVTSST